MKEFLLELGINTNIPQEGSKQYVNIQTTQEKVHLWQGTLVRH